jgi:hypothetical protein
VVDQIEKPHQGDAGLHDAEDASCEEGGVGTGDADRLEDRGAVVV